MRQARGQRKRAIIVLGAGALIALGLLVAAEWPVLLARYHCFRLERADTYAKAAPHLDSLVSIAKRYGNGDAVVDALGPGSPGAMYWVFSKVLQPVEESKERFPYEDPPYPVFGDLVPILRSLEARLHEDGELLRYWAHFLRWQGGSAERFDLLAGDEDLGFMIDPFRPMELFLGRMFEPRAAHLMEEARTSPGAVEGYVRWSHLRNLGEAWVFGVSPPPAPLAYELPFGPQNAVRNWNLYREGRARVGAWVRDERVRLRFDPEVGRCVREVAPSEGGTSTPGPVISQPEAPLPGWKGPIPEAWAKRPIRRNSMGRPRPRAGSSP